MYPGSLCGHRGGSVTSCRLQPQWRACCGGEEAGRCGGHWAVPEVASTGGASRPGGPAGAADRTGVPATPPPPAATDRLAVAPALCSTGWSAPCLVRPRSTRHQHWHHSSWTRRDRHLDEKAGRTMKVLLTSIPNSLQLPSNRFPYRLIVQMSGESPHSTAALPPLSDRIGAPPAPHPSVP